jgi:FAD/FMN-containing dehydrogenase
MRQTTAPKQGNRTAVSVKLKQALGPEKVRDDELTRISYSSDVSPVRPQRPSAVVFPKVRDDVVHVLGIANAYKVPVTVMAGGVNVVGSCIAPEGGIVIDFYRMNRIIEVNTDSGYAVVEPGVNFDRFTAALAEKGYRCSVPTSPGGSTPLGNYLSRPSGSLATRHLDCIVDLEVVLPDGTIMNTGSSQFPNAGSSLRYGPFPDLAGLFCCGYGTLGVVTKAALRIYPINEANRLHLAGFHTYEASVDFVKELTNHNIPEHCIIWNWQFFKTLEVGVVGDEYRIPPEIRLDPRKPPAGMPYVIVTTMMSGYEESMRTNDRICAKVAEKYGGYVISKKQAEALVPGGLAGWEEIYLKYRTVEPTSFGLGKYLAWIVLTEPKVVKDLEKWAVNELSKFKTSPVCYYSMPFDFGRSIFFRIFCYPDPKNDKLVHDIVDKYREMYDVAMKRYGGVPLRVKMGYPNLGVVGGYGKALAKIKQAFDPNDILSPNMGIYEEVTR